MKSQDSPDLAEKCIRFGCGLVFGVFAAGVTVFRLMDSEYAILIGVGVALGCAIFALIQGDRFWSGLRDSWWRW